MPIQRRDFLTGAGGLLAASAAMAAEPGCAWQNAIGTGKSGHISAARFQRPLSGRPYRSDRVSHGRLRRGHDLPGRRRALSHVSIRNRPEIFNEPCVFAAISIKGAEPLARVLEGPVPAEKSSGPLGSAVGCPGATYGLPRFAEAAFEARFPFGKVTLSDPHLPLDVEMTGWSPFEPGQCG